MSLPRPASDATGSFAAASRKPSISDLVLGFGTMTAPLFPWLTHLAPRALSFPDIYKSCFLGAAQCLGGNFPSAASPIGPRGRDARTI